MTAPDVPSWLRPLADRAARREELPVAAALGRAPMIAAEEDLPVARPASVLVLLGEGVHGPDVLLIRRAVGLRKHAGQPGFPGGGVAPEDADAIGTAMREAREETGLDTAGVTVLGTFGDLWIPVSKSIVTPVLAWWHTPSDVYPADEAEIAAVVRAPLRELADPASRGVVRYPQGTSPAFDVSGLVIWGFTGVVLSALLTLLGLDQPWDNTRELVLSPGDSGPRAVTVDR